MGALRIVGAGLPRTGTASLMGALTRLLEGRCCHMSDLEGHPFDLGPGWGAALSGGAPDWDVVLDGYVAAVDWPASAFWPEISAANPDAFVLLSTRATTAVWLESLEATVLPVARRSVGDGADGVGGGASSRNDLVALFERLTGTGTPAWDDPATLGAAYERHNAEVRRLVPASRLIDWHPGDGWEPICGALGLPVPDEEFLWVNRREDWG